MRERSTPPLCRSGACREALLLSHSLQSVREPTQAGRRNNHKTTDEMLRVNFFFFVTLPTGRSPKKHEGRGAHAGMQSLQSSVHHQTGCVCLYVRDSCRHTLPLCFDLSHTRVAISSVFNKVLLSLSQVYVI